MEQKEIELLNLENRILAEKRHLNDLVFHWNITGQPELIQEKLAHVNQELASLEKEVALIRQTEQRINQQMNQKANQQARQQMLQQTDQPYPEAFTPPIGEASKVQDADYVNPAHINPSSTKPGHVNPAIQNASFTQTTRTNGSPNASVPSPANPAPQGKPPHATASTGGNSASNPFPMQRAITPKPKKSNFEGTFGKLIMSIFASTLIFVSMVLFAVLVVPHMSDTEKMITMFVGSAIFLFIGLFGQLTKKLYTFFVTLSGCGTGALFLSLMVTCLYFHAISEAALFALLLVWLVLVCILSPSSLVHDKVLELAHGKMNPSSLATATPPAAPAQTAPKGNSDRPQGSWLYEIIGLCGILISVFFNCQQISPKANGQSFLLLIAYFFVSSTFFELVHYKKGIAGQVLSNTLRILCVLIFDITLLVTGTPLYSYGSYRISSVGFFPRIRDVGSLIIMSVLILIIYCLIQVGMCYFSKLKQKPVLFTSIGSVWMLLILSLIALVCEETLAFILVILLAAGTLTAIEIIYHKERTVTRIIPEIIFCLVLFLTLGDWSLLQTHVFLSPLMLGTLIAGLLLHNQFYLFFSLATFILYSIGASDLDIVRIEQCLCMLTYFITGILLYVKKVRKDFLPKVFLIFAYLTMLFFLFPVLVDSIVYYLNIESVSTSNDLSYLGYLISIAGVNLWFWKHPDAIIPSDKNQAQPSAFTVICTIVGALMMCFNLISMHLIISDALTWISVIVSLGLFCANTPALLKGKKQVWRGIYTGFKFSILLVNILAAFDASDVVTSVLGFVLALICIIIGFIFQQKSLRIYGLILSMVSIIKLLLIDLAFGSVGELALAFLISGVLCFGISLIYHLAEKKWARDDM